MTKLILLFFIVGTSAVVKWSNNPILPGYPVIFGGWGSQPYCDTLHKSEKQCFEDCMTANGHAASIDVANSITPACPPLIQQQHGCFPSWKPVACQCAKRCECKLGRCAHGEVSKCPFCRQPRPS
ncbi:uncharacterized protein [Acropora muricata]|uniref:uncharacterized protein n=1 Tax=Acropora muricata TaxID=159855 RepID=UPI0034E45882